MGTPTCIKFSRVQGTPEQAYQRLVEEFLEPLHLERPSFVRLRRSDDPWYAGYEQEDEPSPCSSTEDLLEQVARHRLFGSMHLVPYIPGYVYFHVVDVDEQGFTFTAEIDTGLVAWESDRYPMGQWFKMMLTTLTSALRAEVCGYGRAHEVGYDPLDPTQLLDRVRSGALFETWYPTYHAISTELIDHDEVMAAFERRETTLATQDLRHEVSVLGYHLLYILP